jgi:hypothetical protein
MDMRKLIDLIETPEEIRAAIIDKVDKIPNEPDLQDVLRFTNKFALKKDVQAFSTGRNYKDRVTDVFLQALANADIDSNTVNKFLNKLTTDGILNEKLLLTPGQVHSYSQLIDPEWQGIFNKIKGELFEKLSGKIGEMGDVGKGEYLLDIISQHVKRRGAPGDLDVDGTKVELKAGENGRIGPAGSQALVGRFPEFWNAVKHLVPKKAGLIPKDSTALGKMFNLKMNMGSFTAFFENSKNVKFALGKALKMHFPNYDVSSIANSVVDGNGNIDGKKLKEEMLRAAFSSYRADKGFDGIIVMDENVTKFLYIGSEDQMIDSAKYVTVKFPSWVEQQSNCMKVTLNTGRAKVDAPEVQTPVGTPGVSNQASANFESSIEKFAQELANTYNISDPTVIGTITTMTMDAYMQGMPPNKIVGMLKKNIPELAGPKKEPADQPEDQPVEIASTAPATPAPGIGRQTRQSPQTAQTIEPIRPRRPG